MPSNMPLTFMVPLPRAMLLPPRRSRRRVSLRLLQLDPRADDFEVALDRLPQQTLAPIVIGRLAPRGLTNEGRGIADVLKQLGRLRLHRRAAATCSPPR